MLVQETYTEVTDDDDVYGLGKSGLYEPFTDNIGKLFKSYQREFGRCIGKVYIDTPEGNARQIGWVFEKSMKYEDCDKYYLQQTWVTLYEDKPEVKTTHHYKFLS